MRTVSAREANQNFSRLLGLAEEGAEIVVTRRGKPVARLVPYEAGPSAERAAALRRLDAIMRRGLALGGERFDRERAHER